MKKKKELRVAIVGMAPSSARMAPLDDPDIECWSLNHYHTEKDVDHTQFDRWFQMHQPGGKEGHIDDPVHREWLTQKEGPIYMIRHFPEWPGSVEYPFKEVVELYGPDGGIEGAGRPYFSNTIDYMICLAMYRGAKEIQIYGCDFLVDNDNEYYKMRQSVEHYLGIAKGLGIKVYIPRECPLLNTTHIYGYEIKPYETQRLIDSIESQIESLSKAKLDAQNKINTAKAAWNTVDGMQQANRNALQLIVDIDKNGGEKHFAETIKTQGEKLAQAKEKAGEDSNEAKAKWNTTDGMIQAHNHTVGLLKMSDRGATF